MSRCEIKSPQKNVHQQSVDLYVHHSLRNHWYYVPVLEELPYGAWTNGIIMVTIVHDENLQQTAWSTWQEVESTSTEVTPSINQNRSHRTHCTHCTHCTYTFASLLSTQGVPKSNQYANEMLDLRMTVSLSVHHKKHVYRSTIPMTMNINDSDHLSLTHPSSSLLNRLHDTLSNLSLSKTTDHQVLRLSNKDKDKDKDKDKTIYPFNFMVVSLFTLSPTTACQIVYDVFQPSDL